MSKNMAEVVAEVRKVFPRACEFAPVTDDLTIIGWTFRTKRIRFFLSCYGWASSDTVFPDRCKTREIAEGVMRTVVRDNAKNNTGTIPEKEENTRTRGLGL